MKTRWLFLIVCSVLLAACKAPQQVVITKEVPVVVRDTIRVETPVPATINEENFEVDWDGGNFLDTILVQDSTSFAEIIAEGDTTTKKRTYRVKHGRKTDTIYIEMPVILYDTVKVDCPPTLPATPADGQFPWWQVLAAVSAVLLWLTVGRKRKTGKV